MENIKEVLKHIWHYPEEEPNEEFYDEELNILVDGLTGIHDYNYQDVLSYVDIDDCESDKEYEIRNWKQFVKHYKVKRWLYIDDLL